MDHSPGGAAPPTLVLDAGSWRGARARDGRGGRGGMDGVELVLVHETSEVGVIRENLTVNEQGFDPEAPPVDAATAEAFRPTLRGCAAVTARWHGVPVAAGMFTPVEDGRCELVGITTLRRYRGRGFGGAVTARLVEAALEAGASTVFLSTDDEAAIRVYRRVGFHDPA